jgi:hypothetical protein
MEKNLTFAYFLRKYHEIEQMTPDAAVAYQKHALTRAGRHQMCPVHSPASDYLMYLNNTYRSKHLDKLAELFEEEFNEAYVDEALLPSVSTVRRTLKRGRQSRKKLTWVNANRDINEEIAFLRRFDHVKAHQVVDIDGMSQNPHDFEQKFGWAPIGERAVRTQLFIRDRTFAVHAACCEKGFLVWDIFEGTVRGEDVVRFLEKLPEAFERPTEANCF